MALIPFEGDLANNQLVRAASQSPIARRSFDTGGRIGDEVVRRVVDYGLDTVKGAAGKLANSVIERAQKPWITRKQYPKHEAREIARERRVIENMPKNKSKAKAIKREVKKDLKAITHVKPKGNAFHPDAHSAFASYVGVTDIPPTREPYFHTNKKGNQIITHRERVLTIGNSTSWELHKLFIQPCHTTSFLFLSRLLANYQQYQLLSLRYIYVPTNSATTAGLVTSAMTFNPKTSDPTNSEELESLIPSVSTSIRQYHDIRAKRSDLQMRKTYWTDADLTDATDQLSTAGIYYLGVEMGDSTAVAGRLYVEYTCELMKPKLQSISESPVLPSYHITFTNLSPAAPFATVTEISSNQIHGGGGGSQLLVFESPGLYRVTRKYTSTAALTLGYPTSNPGATVTAAYYLLDAASTSGIIVEDILITGQRSAVGPGWFEGDFDRDVAYVDYSNLATGGTIDGDFLVTPLSTVKGFHSALMAAKAQGMPLRSAPKRLAEHDFEEVKSGEK